MIEYELHIDTLYDKIYLGRFDTVGKAYNKWMEYLEKHYSPVYPIVPVIEEVMVIKA